MKESRHRWIAEALALLLPVLLVSAPFLFTRNCLLGREFRATFRARFAYAQESAARDGEWPRWNGRQHAGAPFLGDLQGALHYPPHLLPLAVAPERAFGWIVAFHMIVAAIGMYRLSRYFEFRRSAAVLGGLAYGISFSFALHMSEGNPGHVVTPALAPWALLLILRMMKRVSTFRIILLSLVAGGVLLGGSPRDLPILVLMSAGLVLWTSIDAGRRKRPWKKSAMIPVALAFLLGAALAAASLLPALEVREQAAAPGAVPGLAGDWRMLYVGVLPGVLALLPFQAPRRGPALFFALSAAAAALPGLPFCSLWAVALCLSGLAAMGWDGLARGRYQSRNIARILIGAASLAAVGAGLAYWRLHAVHEPLLMLGLLGLSALLLTRLRSHPRAILAAVLLTAGDLWYFDAREIRTVPAEDYAAPPWYAPAIREGRDEYRLYDLTSADAAPAAHGFRLLNGYGYPRPAGLGLGWESLGKLNVRWLVSATALPDASWKELARDRGRILFENPDPRRRAWLEDGPATPLNIAATGNSIEVGGRTYRAGVIVVSESWMPGWKAYVARRQVPIHRGPQGLMHIEVPGGDWYVTLRYEPDAYRIGRIVSSSTLALLFGLLVAGMKRSKIAVS